MRVYLKSILGEINSCVLDDGSEQAKLVGFKASVLTVVEQLTVIHEEILALIDPAEIEKEVLEHMEVLQPSYEILAKANLKITKFSENIVNAGPNSNVLSNENNNSVHCKLPKMELPVFKVDPLEWQGFWDRFQASIHNNDSLADIDRFNYLKGNLKGEALAAISGLSLNSENYQQAVAILKERYGNEQVLISAHMESMLRIKKIKSKENVRGLRTLYNHIENCVRNLKALKLDSASYGFLLIPTL